MVEPEKSAFAATTKITQGRSPAYPYIPLSKAVERLNAIVAAGVGRNAYPPETFYQIWELGAQSSGARGTMAALNGFGLVEYDGRGDVRKVKVSDLGLKIALDKVPNSVDRMRALQLAALTPSIHSDLYQRYASMLPAEVVLLTYLTRDKGYNAGAAQTIIDEYKDTLSFAGLDKPVLNTDSATTLAGTPLPSPDAKVGDLVMIEIDGALLFAEPKRVEEIREHEGEQWVFVEGEKTAVKMEQAIVQSRIAVGSASSRSPNLPPTRALAPAAIPAETDELPPDWVEERLIDDAGDEIKIRYRGKATVERYQFIHDYLDFKINRLKPKPAKAVTNEATDKNDAVELGRQTSG